jgi:tripartite ATP-independent transporter DctM subunit
MLIVMGPVLGVSIVELLAAAFIPGFILSSLYIAYAMGRSLLNPSLGPPLPVEERATSYGQMLAELFHGVIPMGFIIFAALGSIIAGLATPTEAAAMGASGSLLLCIVYRRLTFEVLRDAVYKTLQTSSLVLFLAVASNVYGSVFTRLGTGTMIANAVLALPVPPMVLLALVMVVIFLLGWPLEWPAIVLIFLPIFLPVVQALKVNMVWFGILVAVNLQTAFLSPPVAMAAYYLKAVAPQWELTHIYRGMFDFMVLQCIGLAIVFFFPDTALWLPRLVFGR